MVCSCSNNGLNKPITEELSPKEIEANTKRYSFFEEEYPRWERISAWVLRDEERIEEYGRVRYKDLVYCVKNRPSEEMLDDEHKALFPQREALREKADSIVNLFMGMRPDSLVSLEFVSVRTYRMYIGRNSEYTFLAKPLKDGVEQFRFEFGFAPKIDGKKELSEVSRLYKGFGTVTVPLTSERRVIGNSQELFIGGIDETTEELKRDFDFFYKITDVRFRGQNWDDAPFAVQYPQWYTRRDGLLDAVIMECIDEDYLPFIDYKYEAWNKFYERYNTTVADLLKYPRTYED